MATFGTLWHFVGSHCRNRNDGGWLALRGKTEGAKNWLNPPLGMGAALWHFVGKAGEVQSTERWGGAYIWSGREAKPRRMPHNGGIAARNEREGRVAKLRSTSCHGGDSHADLVHSPKLPYAGRKSHAGRVAPAHRPTPRHGAVLGQPWAFCEPQGFSREPTQRR